jgi:hypothetical protein
MGGLIDVIGSKIIKLVGATSPLIASVLGTPLAGVAVSLLAEAFGKSPSDMQSLYDALGNDPDAVAKIRAVEASHQEALAAIAARDYETEVDDRKHAREHNVCYKDFLRHMAFFVTLGFFGVLLLLFMPIELGQGVRDMLTLLVGMLASKWQTIIDFFYGSSRPQTNQGGLKS